jgi:hypothetical protein
VKSHALTTINTRKWGKISYPKGSKPIVVQVTSNGSIAKIEGLGYRQESELIQIREELKKKARNELPKDHKADFSINFPKTKKRPVTFSVIGEQPLQPRVLHHPAWPPSEQLVKDIKNELKKHPKRKTASDLEAMTYLSTASMAAPLNNQYYRIYFYLTQKYLKSKGWKKHDKNMKFLKEHKTLSEYDKRELNRLKIWIFKKQKKELAERRKQSKKLRKERGD